MQFSLIVKILLISIISKINTKPIKNLRYLSESSPIILPISINPEISNKYYITLFFPEIENETKFQSYILDTTFPYTTSPCKLCKTCTPKINNFFDIKPEEEIKCNTLDCFSLTNSNQCIEKNNQCSFNFNESDIKSLSGFFYNKQISFDSDYTKNKYNISIGCTIEQSDYFNKNIYDGIIGLNNDNITIVDMLYNYKIIKNKIFSIFISRKGGFFSLGKERILNNNINYIPIMENTDNKNLYIVKINNIQIGKNEYNKEILAYIDSSNHITYLPENLYEIIIKNFFEFCDQNESLCGKFNFNEEKGYCVKYDTKKKMENIINTKWPEIIINFENFIFNWQAKDYYVNGDENEACIGFKEKKEEEYVIFGTNFMLGKEIIFDKENNVIGFGEFMESKESVEEEEEEEEDFKEKEKNEEKEIPENKKENEIVNEKNKENNENENNNENEEKNNKNETESDLNETLINTTSYNISTNNNTKENNTELLNNTTEQENIKDNNTSNNETQLLNNTTNISKVENNTNITKNNTNEKPKIIIDDNENNTNITDNINSFQQNESSISSFNSSTQNSSIYSSSSNIKSNVEKSVSSSSSISSSNPISSSSKIEKSAENSSQSFINNTETKTSINKTNKINNEEDIIDNKNSTNTNKMVKGFFDNLKLFVTNKLIYFILALVGFIVAFGFVIFFTCALIKCCAKYKERDGYFEQIDVGDNRGTYSSSDN